VERIQKIGDDGSVVFDVSDLAYVHLNAIKVPGAGTAGVVREIVLEGTVKPVSGILSLINNGDAEGTDLESFPVSYDGPNNGDTANERPEIVSGGIDGGKCFKVTAFPDPTQTWHTQFYIKADETMAKGSKWTLSMAIKADKNTKITTSAQANPRQWKGGFIDEFSVGTEWKEYTWSGEIGVDDFRSIAFDLNNGDERNADDNGWLPGNGGTTFYFDNIQFGYDLGGSNPMTSISTNYGSDIIRIDLNNSTNIKALVEAAGGKTLIFDNKYGTVTWNGNTCEILSIEGRPDGNLYMFLMTNGTSDDFNAEDAEVKVSFTNPEDPAYHLTFINGKWEGQAVPDFSGIIAPYDEELAMADIASYLWGGPELETAEPEPGSFNLPADTKEFKITFNQKVDVATVNAKLNSEKLTVTPAEGLAQQITLTRTGAGNLDGTYELRITGMVGEKEMPQEEDIVIRYSFGQTSLEGDEQPEVIYASNFTGDGDNANGAGWKVNADNGGLQEANSGGGCRLMHGRSGFAADVLYLAQRATATGGVALYGLDEEHPLTLEAKPYHVTLDAAQWDAYNNKRSLKVQVLPLDAVSADDGSILDEGAVIAQMMQQVTPEFNNSKDATHFDLAVKIAEPGNYVIRLVPGKEDGTPNGYSDGNAIANVKVEFIPDVMGLVEMKALAEALTKAKATRESNSDERYNGAAFTALDEAIKQYDGKVMTSPTAYTKAVAELEAAGKALSDHRALCDTYDPLPEQAQTIIDNNAGTKFATLKLFADLKAAVAKYATTEQETNVDPDTGEEVTVTVVHAKELKDDAELQAAVTELKNLVGLGNYMFTTGESKNSDTGVKVLVERLRLGAETLKKLGVDENDPIFTAVNSALTDDDALADWLKTRVKTALYDKMANDKDMFKPVVDESTLEESTPTYDMSVFAKNPNIYILDSASGYDEENVPGWTLVSEDKPGFYVRWDPQLGVANLPEDGAFTTWYGNARVEQTITDLPAGVYTITLYGTDWGNQNGDDKENPHEVESFVYAKTSATPAVAEGEEELRDVNFAATTTIFYAGQWAMDGKHELKDITVTDGKLTFGINYKGDSQYFFGQVSIALTAPAAGYDYGKAYQDALTGVDTQKAAQVKAIELFDLNGKRIPAAKKGVVIVRKHMSDGTVKTEKVVK